MKETNTEHRSSLRHQKLFPSLVLTGISKSAAASRATVCLLKKKKRKRTKARAAGRLSAASAIILHEGSGRTTRLPGDTLIRSPKTALRPTFSRGRGKKIKIMDQVVNTAAYWGRRRAGAPRFQPFNPRRECKAHLCLWKPVY